MNCYYNACHNILQEEAKEYFNRNNHLTLLNNKSSTIFLNNLINELNDCYLVRSGEIYIHDTIYKMHEKVFF